MRFFQPSYVSAILFCRKFANCAARALPAPAVEQLQDLLLKLDETASLRAVVSAIEVARPEKLMRRA